MSIGDIPVRVYGPGSQPHGDDEQALSYIDMPSDMATWVAPSLPPPDEVADLCGARECMDWLRDALNDYEHNQRPIAANLNALTTRSRDLVNQMLGEGEVSVNFDGRYRARTQESVLAGVWRTLYFDAEDRVCFDVLEVAASPHTVRSQSGIGHDVDTSADSVLEAQQNALSILVELDAHVRSYSADGAPHSINLTLLPLTDDELAFLEFRLGHGPVEVLSRAYGKCQVTSTDTKHVWWVRYFNSMNTMILNSIEVVDVPAVVAAAPEDIHDSRLRLEEILAPYWVDVA